MAVTSTFNKVKEAVTKATNRFKSTGVRAAKLIPKT